ncbi:MAG: hypothetical protein U0R17_01425 [Acidimicrobiia bacterium]
MAEYGEYPRIGIDPDISKFFRDPNVLAQWEINTDSKTESVTKPFINAPGHWAWQIRNISGHVLFKHLFGFDLRKDRNFGKRDISEINRRLKIFNKIDFPECLVEDPKELKKILDNFEKEFQNIIKQDNNKNNRNPNNTNLSTEALNKLDDLTKEFIEKIINFQNPLNGFEKIIEIAQNAIGASDKTFTFKGNDGKNYGNIIIQEHDEPYPEIYDFEKRKKIPCRYTVLIANHEKFNGAGRPKSKYDPSGTMYRIETEDQLYDFLERECRQRSKQGLNIEATGSLRDSFVNRFSISLQNLAGGRAEQTQRRDEMEDQDTTPVRFLVPEQITPRTAALLREEVLEGEYAQQLADTDETALDQLLLACDSLERWSTVNLSNRPRVNSLPLPIDQAQFLSDALKEVGLSGTFPSDLGGKRTNIDAMNFGFILSIDIEKIKIAESVSEVLGLDPSVSNGAKIIIDLDRASDALARSRDFASETIDRITNFLTQHDEHRPQLVDVLTGLGYQRIVNAIMPRQDDPANDERIINPRPSLNDEDARILDLYLSNDIGTSLDEVVDNGSILFARLNSTIGKATELVSLIRQQPGQSMDRD